MTVWDVYQWLDSVAPFSLSEEGDNVGLIVGDRRKTVSRVLFTVDVTPAVANYAVQSGAELIVSHHPLMFIPTRRVLYDECEGATIRALCSGGVSLIAAHTNLDVAAGGVGDSLANAIGLRNLRAASDGIVRLGELSAPLPSDELEAKLVSVIGGTVRRLASDGEKRLITTLAIGVGAYSEGYISAVNEGAQAYLTGEMKHHDTLYAVYKGLTVFECGHYATERMGVERLRSRFAEAASANAWHAESLLYPEAPYYGAIVCQKSPRGGVGGS